MPKDIKQDDFQTEVIEASKSKPILVDFWAPWCGPCKMLGPVLEEVAKELGDKAEVIKINVDENQEKAQEYNIMGIPNMKIFKNGEVVDEIVGVRTKDQILEVINKQI